MPSYERCTLCAHRCGVNRMNGEVGVCCMGDTLRVARASLHPWEEPPISGKVGSGTIFFAGCSLGCVYCQNREISRGGCGVFLSEDSLIRTMLSLETKGAANINLVTPTHYIPTLTRVIPLARERGLTIPIVYNTASYETPEALRALWGKIDVYLPDLKYVDPRLAARYSHAADYPQVAKAAIAEMVRQCPVPCFDAEGNMTSGVICRVLLLPGAVANAKLAVSYLYKTYGDQIYISLMNQYTPQKDAEPPLHRTVTREEYRDLVAYALRLGIRNAFIQEEGTASESFIPSFDGRGIIL